MQFSSFYLFYVVKRNVNLQKYDVEKILWITNKLVEDRRICYVFVISSLNL